MSLADMLLGEVLDDKLVDSLEDRFEDVLSEYLILSLADVRILGAIFTVYSFVMVILSNADTYFVMPSLFILIALALLSLFYRLAGTRPVAVWASVSLSILIFIPMVSFYDYKLQEYTGNQLVDAGEQYNLELLPVIEYFGDYQDENNPKEIRSDALAKLTVIYKATKVVEDRFYDQVSLVNKGVIFAFKMMFSLFFIYMVFLLSTIYLSNILAHHTKRGAFPMRRYWSLYSEKVGRVSCAYLVLIALCFQNLFPKLAFAMWFALPVLTMYVPMALLFGGRSNDILYLAISRTFAARRRWHLLPLAVVGLVFLVFIGKLPEGILNEHPGFIKVIGPAMSVFIGLISFAVFGVALLSGTGLMLAHRVEEALKESFRNAGIIKKGVLLIVGFSLLVPMIMLVVAGTIGGWVSRIKVSLLGADTGQDNIGILTSSYEPRILEFRRPDPLYAPSITFQQQCRQVRDEHGLFKRA
ncbi:MAG: hypothetical protein QGG50_01345 [Methanopyri archaeon]|nr:hypothetical protein [Methanopyri archaeon]